MIVWQLSKTAVFYLLHSRYWCNKFDILYSKYRKLYKMEESIDDAEVLNISYNDSDGNLVLNDEYLLSLVQQYPFLYNTRVSTSDDIDYHDWAWQRITEDFNEHYSMFIGTNTSSAIKIFTTDELLQRWDILMPIVYSLHSSQYINAIPDSLRDIVKKFSQHLEKLPFEVNQHPKMPIKSIFQSNIEMVEGLKPELRLKLEAEIMEVILAAELKNNVQTLKTTDLQRVEQEYNETLNIIGLNNDKSRPQNDPTVKDESPVMGQIEVKADEVITIVEKETSDFIKMEECLLETKPQRVLPVKVNKHGLFSQRCVVRIKRLNFEDYIPLAKIKR